MIHSALGDKLWPVSANVLARMDIITLILPVAVSRLGILRLTGMMIVLIVEVAVCVECGMPDG